jgi:hypothetical protein
MIVSHRHRFVFVHIHKTGGMSVGAALAPVLGPGDLAPGIPGAPDACAGLHKHSPASAIAAHIGPRLWDDYFTFAFVRDPYARLASLYGFVQASLARHRSWKGQALRLVRGRSEVFQWAGTRALEETEDFSGWLRHPAVEDEADGARPQTEWLCDGDGVLVDFVGRFEELASDFAVCCERIGLPDVRLPHINRSGAGRKLAGLYRSQADLDLVYARYRGDFERWGYPRRSLHELG